MSVVLGSRHLHTLLDNKVQSTMNDCGGVLLESVNLAIDSALNDYKQTEALLQ